ncbi:NYN domain-containing protein [Sansalvadorimonas verongulae]|uniref:NYN domain-containing protein n=1 Tax=Sansalvadorimonas verongulae TaxID=2172824 RepID=UPI0012BC4407|nr:NYN domain-containing protein [Sansalvadorimonas verongulae]MTI12956.1 NYN domain-containing protein [Sansalvadorimonas verongulae]
MARSKIAVFIDAENLTSWVKEQGPEKLVEELSATGQLIVRKAYGNWNNGSIQGFQQHLNRQGFELVHNYHPVSGKNSSDIQLTVDVMETAMRLSDIDWFVLATGDSDFSPLFRRLREMGKEVIGVGPRSPLSDSVKTSCTRYIYTDAVDSKDEETQQEEQSKAFKLAHKALSLFDGAAHCSQLKVRMTALDSAFNEKALGFTSFTDFLRDSPKLEVYQDNKIWLVRFKTKPITTTLPSLENATLREYESARKSGKWPVLPWTKFQKAYELATTLKPLPKEDIPQQLVNASSGQLSELEAGCLTKLMFTGNLFYPVKGKSAQVIGFQIRKSLNWQYVADSIQFSHIIKHCRAKKIPIDELVLRQLAWGEYNKAQFDKVFQMAEERLPKKEP